MINQMRQVETKMGALSSSVKKEKKQTRSDQLVPLQVEWSSTRCFSFRDEDVMVLFKTDNKK